MRSRIIRWLHGDPEFQKAVYQAVKCAHEAEVSEADKVEEVEDEDPVVEPLDNPSPFGNLPDGYVDPWDILTREGQEAVVEHFSSEEVPVILACLVASQNVDSLTKAGLPEVDFITSILGSDVSADQRTELWNRWTNLSKEE